MTAHLADVFDVIAGAIAPDAPALLCDGHVTDWSEFDRASNALARRLLAAGLGVQSKVGLYMRNGPEYVIAFAACLKARLCPYNVNYRYGPAEIAYLLENSDSEALVYDAEFAAVVASVAGVERLKLRVSVGGPAQGATEFHDAASGEGSRLGNRRDAAEDIMLVYTGGTTGLPKGVMWGLDALWENIAPGLAIPGRPAPTTLELLDAQIRSGDGRFSFYVAAPLMHGTGLISALGILCRGGSVAFTRHASFEAERTLETVGQLRCDGMIIVGDAFARPLLDALRAEPSRYSVSHVRAIVSSGMMWSSEVKHGLLEFMPNAYLIDGVGASESSAFASSTTTRGSEPETARFTLTGAVVVDPDTLEPVVAGSGRVGVLAKGGPLPKGYYKDPERTARAYVMIGGVRHALIGDHAILEADGTIRLLGRGNLCINTAGEKVYVEEVELALRNHPAVTDALVFGTPSPRFGAEVTAIVSTRRAVDASELVAHVRAQLAAYKAPRQLLFVNEVPRAANGKADYAAARGLFEQAASRRAVPLASS